MNPTYGEIHPNRRRLRVNRLSQSLHSREAESDDVGLVRGGSDRA